MEVTCERKSLKEGKNDDGENGVLLWICLFVMNFT